MRGTLANRYMLEKNFTRHAHITNFMQGIHELPQIAVQRPHVKNIKKRENLLMKGQTDELNASFGSDYSKVFKKANDKVTGKFSIASSQRTDTKDAKQVSNIKLQFKMPFAEHQILKASRAASHEHS